MPAMSPKILHLARDSEPVAGRSDDELMLLSSAGAQGAFEELVRRHAGRVLGFCAKNVADPRLGEELAQEVWLSVWDHRRSYEPEGKFAVWLFTLAKNRVRNERRDAVRRGTELPTEAARDPDGARDLSPDGLDRMIIAERRSRIVAVLGRIPERLCEAVVLRFSQELPYDEIARILATNEATARSRVFHGLCELRRRLKGEP